jgi:spore maturation protein CgeB
MGFAGRIRLALKKVTDVQIVLFYPSLIADWNNGNAHFLRGIVRELSAAGHVVTVYEPADGWSLGNMLAEHGLQAVQGFYTAYPGLDSVRYRLDRLELDAALATAQLVLVHEWNAPELVARIGAHRAHSDGYRLLFHDTHHRSITDRESMAGYDLRHYDGVLAFGAVIRDLYLREGWARQAWVWHEAADTQLFRPCPAEAPQDDLVWIGNWGDEERTAELHEFLLEPVRELGLRANVYGVRYPAAGQQALAEAGIRYHGWLANYDVPQIFARHRVTIHIPRRPYVRQLPGIPTIRPFEALACGIPLISAPWSDSERLFRAGHDYLVARSGTEMSQLLRLLLEDRSLAQGLAEHGRRSLLARHTCRHRVEELLSIYAQIANQRPLERQVGAATAI